MSLGCSMCRFSLALVPRRRIWRCPRCFIWMCLGECSGSIYSCLLVAEHLHSRTDKFNAGLKQTIRVVFSIYMHNSGLCKALVGDLSHHPGTSSMATSLFAPTLRDQVAHRSSRYGQPARTHRQTRQATTKLHSTHCEDKRASYSLTPLSRCTSSSP